MLLCLTGLETRTKKPSLCASVGDKKPWCNDREATSAAEVRTPPSQERRGASSIDRSYSQADVNESIHAGTQKMVNYTWIGRGQRKRCWRLVAILTIRQNCWTFDVITKSPNEISIHYGRHFGPRMRETGPIELTSWTSLRFCCTVVKRERHYFVVGVLNTSHNLTVLLLVEKWFGQNWPEIVEIWIVYCMRFNIKLNFLQKYWVIPLGSIRFLLFIKIRTFWDVLQPKPLRFSLGKTSLKLKCSKIFQNLRHMQIQF